MRDIRVPEKKNFFISYTSADESWANWIAGQLNDAGYSTVHQAWDFRPGQNFVSAMKNALENSERTLAVYSPNYFHSGFGEDEWTAAFAARSLVPVRVRECEIPKLLKPRVYIDLVTRDEGAARAALLAGVQKDGAVKRGRQPFPGSAPKATRFPGDLPEIWEVPHPRNPNFKGRDQMLKDLRAALVAGRSAALTQAIAGLGGVGKTQLALEYCYRYSSEYGAVCWMRAEEPTALASDYAGLAARLNLPEKDLQNQSEIIAAVRGWLEHHSGWLLVFDNPTGPEACDGYRPRANTGHILITSRNPAWRGIAEPLPVQQLARTESGRFSPSGPEKTSRRRRPSLERGPWRSAAGARAGRRLHRGQRDLPPRLREVAPNVCEGFAGAGGTDLGVGFRQSTRGRPGGGRLAQLDSLPRARRHSTRSLAIHGGEPDRVQQIHPGAPAARLLNQAGVYEKQPAQFSSAEKLFRQSLEISEKALGPDHGFVAVAANNLGQILQDQGDLEGALRYASRALRIFQSTYGPDHPSTKAVAGHLRLLEGKSSR